MSMTPKHTDSESIDPVPADQAPPKKPTGRSRVEPRFWWTAAAQALLLWCCHTPLKCWPMVFFAVAPFFWLASSPKMTRRHYGVLYLFAFAYWALTLQGIRHAHPALYLGWLALAGYLAIYHLVFVGIIRKTLFQRAYQGDDVEASKPNDPPSAKETLSSKWLWIVAPTVWVGLECIRNYFLTGISAAMLGHALSDVPTMIQIADIGGTYAVSAITVMINVAVFHAVAFLRARKKSSSTASLPLAPIAISLVATAITIGYGRYRLSQPLETAKATFALIGLNEPIEYKQSQERELELFDAYARQSITAVQNTDQKIDAIIWPESMFTGSIPWLLGDASGEMATTQGFGKIEFDALIQERQRAFQFRADSLQQQLVTDHTQSPPQIVAGCGIVDYGQTTQLHSGVVHVGAQGALLDWYAKTHLVLYGERFPVLDWVLPMPSLTPGDGPKRFHVANAIVSPNICIETAVERVTLNHLRRMQDSGQSTDVIVTVTNDGWFDDSSIVQHHKRCAQLVAVACRRPILSSANNGPTVWIDSNGRVVEELPQGQEGHVIASPRIDQRVGLVMTFGDWPARMCALISIVLLFRPQRKLRLES